MMLSNGALGLCVCVDRKMEQIKWIDWKEVTFQCFHSTMARCTLGDPFSSAYHISSLFSYFATNNLQSYWHKYFFHNLHGCLFIDAKNSISVYKLKWNEMSNAFCIVQVIKHFYAVVVVPQRRFCFLFVKRAHHMKFWWTHSVVLCRQMYTNMWYSIVCVWKKRQ